MTMTCNAPQAQRIKPHPNFVAISISDYLELAYQFASIVFGHGRCFVGMMYKPLPVTK